MESSDIQYARSGGVSVAYQVFGTGAIDLAFVPFLFNLAFGWTHPKFGRLIERLTSFARVIVVDKRGTGLSDRFREVRRSRRGWTTSAPCWTRWALNGRRSWARSRAAT